MLKRSTLFLTFMMAFVSLTFAQDTWDLKRCVEYARTNNITVKSAQTAIKSAQLTEKQSRYNRLPNLNANTGLGLSFGRNIDPITDQFITQSFGSNSLSVSSGVVLYEGNRLNNTIKQNRHDLEAAREDANATSNDIGLNIASTYLTILLAQEQLENAQNRLTLSQEQLEQTDKLIQAGALPQNDRLDFLAQIARDEQSIVDAQNLVEVNMLTLKNLMELDPSYNLRLEVPEIEVPENIDPELFDLRTIYNQALGNQPIVKADDARLKSAELGVDIAKSGYYPRITLGGSLSSAFSTGAKEGFGPPEVEFGSARPVRFNGTEGLVEFGGLSYPNERIIPYFEQLNQNFGGGVSLSVNVPIFNNNQTNIAVERAQLGIINSQLNAQQNRQQLKVNIQRAIADSKAARKSLDAAQKTVSATKAAYENAQKRFRLGAINTFEFTTAKNNYDIAQIDLIRAKYQYIFNLKIVEFYQGKPLKL